MQYATQRDKPVLVFVHLPKTGGSTIHKLIERLFIKPGLASVVLSNKKYEAFPTLSEDERNSFDYIGGHFQADIHHHVSRPCLYFTFLREPLSTRISYYYYILRQDASTNHLKRELIEKKANLETFLLQPQWGGEIFDNRFTCQLSGSIRFPIHRPQIEKATSAMLERAKSELRDRFMFVGLTERLADSVFMLSHKIQRRPHHFRRHNVNKPNLTRNSIRQLSPEIVARFEENNRFDIELYDDAKQLFERQWNALGTREQFAARVYRHTQRLYERLPPPPPFKNEKSDRPGTAQPVTLPGARCGIMAR